MWADTLGVADEDPRQISLPGRFDVSRATTLPDFESYLMRSVVKVVAEPKIVAVPWYRLSHKGMAAIETRGDQTRVGYSRREGLLFVIVMPNHPA